MLHTRLAPLTHRHQQGLVALFAEDLPYFPIPSHWGDTPQDKALGCLHAAHRASQQLHVSNHWAAIEHNGDFAGFCQYLHGKNADEFGIVLKQSARGQGVAKVAVASLLYTAYNMGRTTVGAMVAEANVPSRRMMAALGFGTGHPLPEDESYFHDASGWPIAALWFEKPLIDLVPTCARILGDTHTADRAAPGVRTIAAKPRR